jgi:tetratricopeptide (TPR) repeat protein
MGSTGASDEERLRIANRQYSAGNLVTAGDLARDTIIPEDSAELFTLRHFLIGAGYAQTGLLATDNTSRRFAFHSAVEHLQRISSGWPPGREDEGERLLGESLFGVGYFAAAIPHIESVLDRNPTYQAALTPTLARCLARGSKRDVARAVQTIDDFLESPGLAIENYEMHRLRAECLILLGQHAVAREQLRRILNTIADGGEITARKLEIEETELLLASVDISEAIALFGPGSLVAPQTRKEIDDFLAPAMDRLFQLQRDASGGVAIRTGIWIARGLLCLGKPIDALSQLNATRLYQPFEGEGIAAAMEEIEYLVALGNGREAVQTARYVVQEIKTVQNFDASVIDLQNFRQRIQLVLSKLREQGDTENCVSLARSLPPLLPADQAAFEQGLAFRDVGNRIMSDFRGDWGKNGRETTYSAAAKSAFIQASQAFDSAARLRYSSNEYCQTLWEAILAYQLSGQFLRSIDLLETYLQFEERIRHPRAFIALGRAYLAIAQPEAAIKPLMECVTTFPRDPLCYDARLLAAKALAELNRIEEARELLETNLTDGDLTPQSLTWKDSLLTLSELLWRRCQQAHTEQEFQAKAKRQEYSIESLRKNQPLIEDGIARLSEAVGRYWPDKRAMQAAASLAAANRLAAVLPGIEAQAPDALDATRRRLLRQREVFLRDAVQAYRQLRKELSRIEDERGLELAEQSLQQIGMLGEADTLFELGQFEESADAYRTISLRYMNEPPALEAMLGQARCLKSLNRNREARLVIRQAAVVLSRIPTEWDDRFQKTTRHDRAGWQKLLTWMDSGPIPEDIDG